eukprot:jgi/Botrbrau1/10911/Bobra.0025s0084.1
MPGLPHQKLRLLNIVKLSALCSVCGIAAHAVLLYLNPFSGLHSSNPGTLPLPLGRTLQAFLALDIPGSIPTASLNFSRPLTVPGSTPNSTFYHNGSDVRHPEQEPDADRLQHDGVSPSHKPKGSSFPDRSWDGHVLQDPIVPQKNADPWGGTAPLSDMGEEQRVPRGLPDELKTLVAADLGETGSGETLNRKTPLVDSAVTDEELHRSRLLSEQYVLKPQHPEIGLPAYWRSRNRTLTGKWPKVFLYPMPGAYHDDRGFGWSILYGAEEAIPVVLKEMGHVVEDPEDADLYFVHAWFYNAMRSILARYGWVCPGHGWADSFSCILIHALQHIRKNFPFFDRSSGVDHIWPMTYDHGFCGFAGAGDMNLPEIAGGIIAAHWGLSKPEFSCTDKQRMQDGRCYDMKYRDQRSKLKGGWQPRLACYVPGKDILAVPVIFDQGFGANRSTILEGAPPILPPEKDPDWPPDTGQEVKCAVPIIIKDRMPTPHMYPNRHRDITAFFAGNIDLAGKRYSHGVRQALYVMYNQTSQHPGFMMLEGAPNAFMWQTRARFCLALTGAGWGSRFKTAILCGCIPVVISDDVAVENNDVIDLRDISIRLPERYTYMVPEVLNYLEEHHADMVEVMQRRIACAWRYWVWTLPYGRAGEAFVCSLRRKLVGHQALLPRMDWDSCTLHCQVPGDPLMAS